MPEGLQAIDQVVQSSMHSSLVQAHMQHKKNEEPQEPEEALLCKTGERLSEPRPANTDNQCFSTLSQRPLPGAAEVCSWVCAGAGAVAVIGGCCTARRAPESTDAKLLMSQ